ncbi:MAG: carbohydrate kinase [Bacteroides sp.]|nr:carbohydrate kinase [Bacteroides sp.]
MRKVIGIGETILDVLFKDNQPVAAVPGGSVFNGLVSLSRLGAHVSFIGELADDKVGAIISDFMKQNDINTEYVYWKPNQKSPLSLAFLAKNKDPEFLFYKDYTQQELYVNSPKINENDIVIFGSYYAINPAIRDKTKEILLLAKKNKAIIYYDPNFRNSHKNEALKLNPIFIENLEFADIVRGAAYDFQNMYELTDAEKIYKDKVSFYCPNFIYTAGKKPIQLRTASIYKSYQPPAINPVSTIGAGDNFNAGIIYGLLKENITLNELYDLSEEKWDRLINYAMLFSSEVCKDYSNSISRSFANQYLLKD